ncbi:MAG: glycosyltransferase [Candidatus Pacebacteria bacterium]|nr:glycosyltransferase [Candidatus Paceibacterota bacterium]
MKLLILTQAVDTTDPVLGFFHEWIRVLASRFEQIEVICLKEGTHDLPNNVRVHSLGKEGGESRLKYLTRFYSYTWSLRHDYDAVFVHMNEEYAILGGWLWRLMGKRVYLWRNYHKGTWRTNLAALFCTNIFCTSKYSYTTRFKKNILMPVGVDTDRFSPEMKSEGERVEQDRARRTPRSVLFLSGMWPSKRPEMLIDALAILKKKEIAFTADFYGSPLEETEKYYAEIQARAAGAGLIDLVSFHPGVRQTPDLYRTHQVFVNCSPSGMFDKTLFEAAASGCRVLAASDDFADLAGDDSHFDSVEMLVDKLETALQQPINTSIPAFVADHSLTALADKLKQKLDRPLRVRMLTNDVLLGGAEVMIADILRRLNKEEFDAAYWYLREFPPSGGGDATLRDRFPDSELRLVNLNVRTLFQGISQIAKRLRKEHIDVVHCHLPDAVIMGGTAAIIAGVPFIIHEHQTHEFHSWKIRLAYKLLRPFAAVTICFIEGVEADLFGSSCVLNASLKKLERRSYTVPNGIDTLNVQHVLSSFDRRQKRKEFGVTDTDVMIVAIARLIAWKGHRLLIEAFASIAEQVPQAKLYIVGGGPDFDELQRIINAGHLQECIYLTGFRTDIYEILAASDIFSLVFTFPEGVQGDAIGIAGFEAMAFGLPVIVGAYRNAKRYVIDGENGIVVPPGNPDALGQAILRLTEDKTLRETIGKHAHNFIEKNLSLNTIVPIYESIYKLLT